MPVPVPERRWNSLRLAPSGAPLCGAGALGAWDRLRTRGIGGGMESQPHTVPSAIIPAAFPPALVSQAPQKDIDRDGLLRLVRGGCGRVDPALLVDHVFEIAADEDGILLSPALRAIAKRVWIAKKRRTRVKEPWTRPGGAPKFQ